MRCCTLLRTFLVGSFSLTALWLLPEGLSQPGQKMPWQRRLQGTWKREKIITNGKESTLKSTTTFMITFKDNEYTRKSGEKITTEGVFEVDPSKGPALLELTTTKSGLTPVTTKTKILYSFTVSDDTLILAIIPKTKTAPKPAMDRPDTLEPGPGRVVYIYRRVK